jgi:6,7-dimethyl-8-ribityllumazine synthase
MSSDHRARSKTTRADFGVPVITLDQDVSDARIGIIATSWAVDIIDKLVEGAIEALHEAGISSSAMRFVRVPGAFEVPHAADGMAGTGRFHGLIALSAVVRGDTPHFDFVAGECARGVQDVSIKRELPIGFGVLTVDNIEQAEARATPDNNKGREAAEAMLDMMRFDRAMRLL